MMRIGIGYDVHAFKQGRQLILGGINIDYYQGLDGHSDADVLVHSICDALLGALKLGDIGMMFPDTDKTWKNISSLVLLKNIAKKIKQQNWQVNNIDSIIIAQKPQLRPFIPMMENQIAKTLFLKEEQVSIKATTTEHLGFTGREEGIAAQAVVLLSPFKK